MVPPDGIVRPRQGATAAVARPARVEPRLIELDLPKSVKMGNESSITLSLKAKVSADGTPILETAVVPEGRRTDNKPVTIPLVYEAYKVSAKAELGGSPLLGITGPQPSVLPLAQGEQLDWTWVLRPSQTGDYIVTPKLTLSFKAKAPRTTKPMRAQIYQMAPQTVAVKNLFGLTQGQAAVWSAIWGAVGTSLVGIMVLVIKKRLGVNG